MKKAIQASKNTSLYQIQEIKTRSLVLERKREEGLRVPKINQNKIKTDVKHLQVKKPH